MAEGAEFEPTVPTGYITLSRLGTAYDCMPCRRFDVAAASIAHVRRTRRG
jgi:hypothetical protein